VSNREIAYAREANLELVVSDDGPLPEGVPVHLKLDTGMGRYGLSELPPPPTQVVGLMSHLATADSDPEFAEQQIERFRQATAPYPGYTRHIANSAATLRLPSSRFDAARCGIALYGLSPFGGDPAERRPRARALVEQRARAGQAPPARGQHRVRPHVRRREADLDRDCPRRLRRRLPA
jgi:alanine racemase